MDHIIRFEHLVADYRKVFTELGLPITRDLPQANKTPEKKSDFGVITKQIKLNGVQNLSSVPLCDIGDIVSPKTGPILMNPLMRSFYMIY